MKTKELINCWDKLEIIIINTFIIINIIIKIYIIICILIMLVRNHHFRFYVYSFETL